MYGIIEFLFLMTFLTSSAYMLHIGQQAISLWFFGMFLWWLIK